MKPVHCEDMNRAITLINLDMSTSGPGGDPGGLYGWALAGWRLCWLAHVTVRAHPGQGDMLVCLCVLGAQVRLEALGTSGANACGWAHTALHLLISGPPGEAAGRGLGRID